MKVLIKAVSISAMVLIIGINGMLGSQLVATLCTHGFESLHLTAGSHDEKHNDCREHSYGDPSQGHSETLAITDSEFCENYCTDIEIKGVDNEAPQRNGGDILPNPPITKLNPNHHYFNTFSFATSATLILSPLRGPPPGDVVTELCIKKTVLRL